MKPEPNPDDFHSGPEAAERFDRVFRRVISVPKSTVEKLESKERVKNQRQREKRTKRKAA